MAIDKKDDQTDTGLMIIEESGIVVYCWWSDSMEGGQQMSGTHLADGMVGAKHPADNP